MLSKNEETVLTGMFRDMYKGKSAMELLNIQSELNEFLHQDSAIARRLAFNNNNWKFRAQVKLRRKVIEDEIKNR